MTLNWSPGAFRFFTLRRQGWVFLLIVQSAKATG